MPPVPLILKLKVEMESCVGVLEFARNFLYCNVLYCNDCHGHAVYFESVSAVVLVEIIRLAYLNGRLDKMRREIIVMEM